MPSPVSSDGWAEAGKECSALPARDTRVEFTPEQMAKVRELCETCAEYYAVKASESEANTEAKEEARQIDYENKNASQK